MKRFAPLLGYLPAVVIIAVVILRWSAGLPASHLNEIMLGVFVGYHVFMARRYQARAEVTDEAHRAYRRDAEEALENLSEAHRKYRRAAERANNSQTRAIATLVSALNIVYAHYRKENHR